MKKFFLSFAFLLGSLFTFAQFTAIPDTNFEQYLIDELYDSDGIINGQILTVDAEDVTNLFMNNLGINDMTGIEDFINLESLSCGQNNFNSLALLNHLQLESLVCTSTTSLTSLNVSGCPLLETLNTPTPVMANCWVVKSGKLGRFETNAESPRAAPHNLADPKFFVETELIGSTPVNASMLVL